MTSASAANPSFITIARVPASRTGRPGLNPEQWVLLVILFGTLGRIVFGLTLGMGVDESYMVVAGRHLQLGYFDHPPVAWWLSWAAARLGGEAAIVVRLPFIGLFAASTWFMFRFATRLYGRNTGLWAAILFNLSPVFGVSMGTWVLPDGPLDCALLGAALCLTYALTADGRAAWLWWLATGLCAALAVLSKYVGCLMIAGAFIYLLTASGHRRWLRRPQPYAAALLIVLAVAWIVDWNAAHGWASIAFQGGRAEGHKFRPAMLLTTLAGESLFMLPWLWLPLTALFVKGLLQGPSRARSWLPVCLGAGAIVLFPLVSVWSSQRVLFHWATPGYLFLFPALAHWVAPRLRAGNPWIKAGLIANVVLLVTLAGIAGSESFWNWIPDSVEALAGPADPDREVVNWVSLREDLAARHLLSIPGLYLAATNWHDCGKLGYGMGPNVPVICLTDDPREFGLSAPAGSARGHTVLVVTPANRAAGEVKALAARFGSLEPLPGTMLRDREEDVMPLSLFLGHEMR